MTRQTTARAQRFQQAILTVPEDISYKQYVELVENIKKDKEFPEEHKEAIITNIQMQWARIKSIRMMKQYTGEKRPRTEEEV